MHSAGTIKQSTNCTSRRNSLPATPSSMPCLHAPTRSCKIGIEPGDMWKWRSGRPKSAPPKTDDAKSGQSAVFVSTGEALSVLGDQNAAMDRFRKALIAPDSDRVSVRMAIAQLMAQQGHADDARRQIALALMESEAGETVPATGEQLIEASDVFGKSRLSVITDLSLGP